MQEEKRDQVIMEFKAKTEECFHPINGLGATEIEELVEKYVNAKLTENDFDASVRGVVLSGSRCRGLEGKRLNLDVVVEYTGEEREDDMFNLLHEDKFPAVALRGISILLRNIRPTRWRNICPAWRSIWTRNARKCLYEKN